MAKKIGRRLLLDKYTAYYYSNNTHKIHVIDWKKQDLIVREHKKAFVIVPASRYDNNDYGFHYDCFAMSDMRKDTTEIITHDYYVEELYGTRHDAVSIGYNRDKVLIYRNTDYAEIIFLSQEDWQLYFGSVDGLGIICDRETYTIYDNIKYVMIDDYGQVRV